MGRQLTATRFKAMSDDCFEIANFRDKKLITAADSEVFATSLTVLKSFNRERPKKSSIKNCNITLDLTFQSNVTVFGNDMMTSQNISGALKRRMQTLRADNIIPVDQQLNLLQLNLLQLNLLQLNLLHNSQDSWSGSLVGDLPGIFNWIE